MKKKQEPYIKATRVVHEVHAEMEQYTGDTWLEYRLRTRIAKGDVRCKGDLNSMRLYEVKC